MFAQQLAQKGKFNHYNAATTVRKGEEIGNIIFACSLGNYTEFKLRLLWLGP